jgi:hypothetical protein
MTDINTGGGGSVGRDVDMGRDFIGRDVINNYVSPDALSTDEKLNRIYRYIVGSPIDGLIGQAELMGRLINRMERLESATQAQAQSSRDRQNEIAAQVREHRQEIDGRFTALYFWMSVLGVVVASLVIINLYLLLRMGA